MGLSVVYLVVDVLGVLVGDGCESFTLDRSSIK